MHEYVLNPIFRLRREYFGGLLYNIKTGNFYYVNREGYKYLSQYLHPRPIVLCSFVKTCINNRILVPSEKGHKDSYKNSSNIKRILKERLSAPIRSSIYPTLKCNQKCVFCFLSKRNISNMSYRDFRRIICKLDAINTLIVEILGGEPFLLPWIADALAYIADHQITPEVSTNGSVLNQRTISRLARIDPLIINISIHGFGQVHDKAVGASHFQKVKKALLLLNDFGINHCISCVVFRNNLNKITQLCDFLGTLEKSSRLNLLFCQSLGMAVKNNVCISLLEFWKEYSLIKNYIKSKGYKIYVTTDAPFNFYIENSPKPKNELERQLVGCEALKVRIEILPNGDIYPCCQFFDIPRFKLGNALKDDIGEIWEKFSPDFLKSKISEPKCKENCKYYIECTGCYGYAIRSGIKYDNRCPGYKDA